MDHFENAPDTSPRITVRIDVGQDIDRFQFFLDSATYRVKRSNILRFYPRMHDRISRGENEQAVVREMVTDMYKRYASQVEHIVRETAAAFSQSASVFTALARYMHFPELGQRSYTAIPTFLPFSPLDQNQFYFSIAMAIAKGHSRPHARVAIAVHEISHFILQEQYASWQQKREQILSDKSYHYLKEALTAAIMDQTEFRTYFNYPLLFKSEAYPGNPELHDLQVEIHGACMPLIDLFRQKIENPVGYITGLHQVCEAFTAANKEFDARWKIWNDANGSFDHQPELLESYRKPIQLEIRD